MKRLVSHETWAAIIGMLYLGLIVNLLLVVACLPMVALLMTTDRQYLTVVMGIQRMINVADTDPQWPLVMAAVILAMLPPVAVVLLMQRWFIKGLVETEK